MESMTKARKDFSFSLMALFLSLHELSAHSGLMSPHLDFFVQESSQGRGCQALTDLKENNSEGGH